MKFDEIYFRKLKFVEILSHLQILSTILLSYWPLKNNNLINK